MTIGQALHVWAVVVLMLLPLVVAPEMAIGIAAASCAPGIFYAFRYKSNQSIWAIPYSFFFMTCLSWTYLYAIISPYKNDWMTRKLDVAKLPKTICQVNGVSFPERETDSEKQIAECN